MMQMMTGNAFGQMTIMAMGITPYINASIIMQLLAVAFPSLQRMQEEEGGQEKMARITRYVTVVLALIQAIAYYFLLRSQGAILMDYRTGFMSVFAAVVIVAVFNMATALLTLVLERTRMIGLLKTMGMNNASLRRIFLYRALMLIVRGVVWGNAIGLGICLLQYYFHLIPLDPEGYMLSEVPVAFGVGWWLALKWRERGRDF
mgnify:CR=1 FL=1